MSQENIIKAITPIFQSVLEDDTLKVTRELDANKVEKWDSLNHITLVVELEDTTGVQFTTDEIAGMVNVGDLIDCLEKHGYEG